MAPSTIRGPILARWTKHGRAPLTDPLTLRAIPLPCKITPLGLPPQLPPRPGDGRKAGVQRRSDPAITPGLPGWRGVHLQQDARLRQLLRRVLAAVDQALQLFTLVRTELHKVLLYGDFPRDHEPAPIFIAKPSILTIYSLSMTQSTRAVSVRFRS